VQWQVLAILSFCHDWSTSGASGCGFMSGLWIVKLPEPRTWHQSDLRVSVQPRATTIKHRPEMIVPGIQSSMPHQAMNCSV